MKKINQELMRYALSVALSAALLSTPGNLFGKEKSANSYKSSKMVYFRGENVNKFATEFINATKKYRKSAMYKFKQKYPHIFWDYLKKTPFHQKLFIINQEDAKIFQDYCYKKMIDHKNYCAPLLNEFKIYQQENLTIDSPQWIILLFKIENRIALMQKVNAQIKQCNTLIRHTENKIESKQLKILFHNYRTQLYKIKSEFQSSNNYDLENKMISFEKIFCSNDFFYVTKNYLIAQKLNKIVLKANGKTDFSKKINQITDTIAIIVKQNNLSSIISLKTYSEKLCREIILTHPKLQFNDLLVNMRQVPRYSHNVDQYMAKHAGICPGITVLKNWKSANFKIKNILKNKLPKGSYSHPELSFDGKKVLFEYADFSEPNLQKRRYFIYEAAVDGSWVRQVTGNDKDNFKRTGGRYTEVIEDFDPTYLPNGRIAFTSTRSQNVARCHGRRNAPAFLLYSGNLDGSDIRPLTYGEANETVPTILSDGKILYNRWEYINRHDVQFHMLWAMNPDGTKNMNYYGNLTVNPYSIMNPREVPGSNGAKIMGTATAHHSFANGSIIVIDRNRGEEGSAPITRLTPKVCFPESEGTPPESYATPYPITDRLFLVSYTNENYIYQFSGIQKANAFGLYLAINLDENILGSNIYKTLILKDNEVSVFSPLPIKNRPIPPIIPSSLNQKVTNPMGTYLIQNVYQSTTNIPKGTIKKIRINEILNQPTPKKHNRSAINNEATKKIIGTIPVNANGSAYFEAPAGKPLQLQLLDTNGEAVMTMRSFIYLHPGEFASCLGCHEPRDKTPIMNSRNFRLSNLKLSKITPPAGPEYKETEGFNFGRTVQPILDKNCISCHGLDSRKMKGNVNLLGKFKRFNFKEIGTSSLYASISYNTLIRNPKIYKPLKRNNEPAFSIYKDFFSPNSVLPKMLRKGHGKTKLTKDEIQRVTDWLDVNGQFYGNYSFNRPEYREINKLGVNELRRFLLNHFGKKIANQPLASLINHSDLGLSRILLAPLAVNAGGWGQMKPIFKSTNSSKYQTLVKLVNNTLIPLQYHDIEGTCGRGPQKCICGSCQIRKNEKEYEAKRNTRK